MTDEILKLNDKKYSLTYKPAEISFPEYNQMKAQVDQLRDQLIGWKVTQENMKSSKNTRTELNKFKRALNSRRLEITRSMTKSSRDFKAKIDVLTGEIGDVSDSISNQIKVYEDKAKEDRHNQNLKRIAEKEKEAGIVPGKIEYNPKWDHKTYSNKQFEAEVAEKIEREQQIEQQQAVNRKIVIKKAEKLSLPPDFWLELVKKGWLLDKILQNMDDFKSEQTQLKESREKAKKQQQEQVQVHDGKAINSATGEVIGKIYTVKLEIAATKDQLKKLNSFIKKTGIKAKRVK